MLDSNLKNAEIASNIIKSYTYWHLLLCPKQPTLGSLVLICKESISHYAEISIEALNEQKVILNEIEVILKNRFNSCKMSYQTVMMQEPQVHFHVIPRYENSTTFCNQQYSDATWPSEPDLNLGIQLPDIYHNELLELLTADFLNYRPPTSEKQKKYKRLYTSGSFDIFHQGHLNILKRSKDLCEYLIVGVSTDEVILKAKGKLPVIPFEERISILKANRYVDEVIPQVDKDKQKIVDKYNIDAISVGSDWLGKYPKVTCEMVYFDYTPNVSSTVLKQKLNITPKQTK